MSGKRVMDAERALVWAVRDQRVVWSETVAGLHRIEREIEGGTVYAASACGCAEIERLQELGVRVDGRSGGAEAHPDAVAIYQAALSGDRHVDALLLRYADLGMTPPVSLVERRCYPARDARGDVLVLTTDERARYCELRWTGGPEETEARRREYLTWFDALIAFEARLRRVTLRTIALVPVRLEREPWRVVASGRPASLLDATQRAELIARAREGMRPSQLAELFGLSRRQVQHQIDLARDRGELSSARA